MSPLFARRDDGQTLIEVLVAAAISLTMLAATVALLSGSFNNTNGQKKQLDAQGVLNDQIEMARQLVKVCGFDALGTTAAPAAGANPTATNPPTPNDLVTGTNFVVLKDFHNRTAGYADGTSAAGEPLIVRAPGSYPCATTNGLAMTPSQTITSGSLTLTVYRYVSQRNETVCATAGTCAGESRRVTIAVVPAASASATTLGQAKGPIYLTTILNSATPAAQGSGSGGLELGLNLP
jgi:type II secretory pathway pseudopilin PulG